MKKGFIAMLLLVYLSCGCAPAKVSLDEQQSNKTNMPIVEPQMTIIPSETSEQNAENSKEPHVKEVDLAEVFQGINGCAVIYDESDKEYLIYNKELSEKRSSPCSTFKIVSALIGLKNHYIESTDTLISWSGVSYPISEWNRDQTLEEAFKSSCIWYFRDIIDNVGREAVQKELSELSYGNRDISQWEGSGTNAGFRELNGFWLESSLLISPQEQVDVLSKIFMYEDASVISVLKEVMSVNDGVYGKTGTGFNDGLCVDAWFVGFAEKPKSLYFAVRLDDPYNENVSGQKAKEIALNIIKAISFYILVSRFSMYGAV